MMERGLSRIFLLLLCSSVSVLGSVLWKQYSYYRYPLTWQDAQDFCRSTGYNDLAIIYTQSDLNDVNMMQYDAWLGLQKLKPSRYWTWVNTFILVTDNWGHGEPDEDDECAYISYSSKRFYGTSCERYKFFICHKVDNHRYRYTFINESKTWSEARQYCRSQYDDLAIVEDDRLSSAAGQEDFLVWTGLHRDGGTWKWTAGLSEYRNWASNEPSNDSNCASVSSVNGNMATRNCSAHFPFICYRDNMVVVKENKTWEEALEHCRGLSSSFSSNRQYDLVSVQPGTDHAFVMTKVLQADTEKVWTGLRFLAGHWLWVNGEPMSHSDLPDCPQNGQNCGVLSKNDTGSVEITDCSERRNFICYSKYF
ncbi:macrophage mannose receptor 1-like [Trachinotus anak]|uniref:macrophage mannose receptor 1-like n=1 Tax=Trachinotus anak TaxID=443729 RepID=UPI0039F194AA